MTTSPPAHPAPATVSQLRASGWESASVADELRINLMSRLRSGATAFPGIVGFDDSVLPELETALRALHDAFELERPEPVDVAAAG